MKMQLQILHEAHNTPAEGHFGAAWTYLHMTDQYFRKTMGHDMEIHCACCHICDWTKHRSTKLMRLLPSVLIAKGPWRRNSINFTTDLPVLGNGHNWIVMFVNRMSKGALKQAWTKTMDAQTIVHILIYNIFHLLGVPREVVTDHTLCFTPDYKREVAGILLTKLGISKVFDPKTDCLAENLHILVVSYLCPSATDDWANWDVYLIFAHYGCNSSVHFSMKPTPIEPDLGYELPLLLDIIADPQWLLVDEYTTTLEGHEFVEQLLHLLQVPRDELPNTQDKQAPEADQSQRPIDPAITSCERCSRYIESASHIRQWQPYAMQTDASWHWRLAHRLTTQEHHLTRPPNQYDNPWYSYNL